MSEYWVSKKKYFCKYCDIYIADDAPSRQQHENGLRHKGNVDRFIRSLYKAGEKRKKDQEEEKRCTSCILSRRRRRPRKTRHRRTRRLDIRGPEETNGYDPDAIPIKLKKREEVQVDPAASTAAPASTSTLPQETTVTSTGAPKWTNVQWKKAGELAHEPSAPVTPSEEVVPVKAELQATALPITNKTDPLASPIPSNEEAKHTLLKAEEPLLTPEPSSSSSGMFRKRKAPAGGSGGRRS
ncbi:hypothetical protein H0H87_004792 [Tephrocybe sp. NHM501043]|nr:hypothetical protein H0H87_004792 [Tephrocybe sp. NHM501043]